MARTQIILISKTLEAVGISDLGIPILILFILNIALLVLFIIYLRKVNLMASKLKNFVKGKNAASLENEIVGLFKDTKQLGKNVKLQKYDMEDIKHRLRKGICKIGVVKYDAFHLMGGQLSYALCMLDEEDNGFILNSVQSAESSYTYLKEIISGESRIELGKEEKQALVKAIENSTGKE